MLKEKTLDLWMESKGLIARHVNELSLSQTSYLPQAIQDAAILRNDTSFRRPTRAAGARRQ